MFKPFGKNKQDENDYRKEQLYNALKKDGIEVTEQEIQKARENDPETLYKFGDAYYKKKEYEKAFTWFHKAALQDYPQAQAQLGDMYQWKEGVSLDYKQAMDWSMKAASAGNARGQYLVGYLYCYGDSVSKDYKQAMDWFLKAANNGNTNAMNQIGVMHQSGIYVTKSIPTAIEWYTKAANQGNAIAQHNLGWIYKNHDEVKDLQKAVNWFQKAADNGKGYAKYDVEELNDQGYYAKEDDQEEEEAQDKTINDNDAINNITNDQNQSFTTTNNNDENANKSIDDKLKEMEKAFQLKMNLVEPKYEENSDAKDALQKELVALKQKELDQKEKNRLLKERMARMEAGIQDNVDTDLNYDSSDDEIDDENDINYDSECSKGEQEQDIHPTAESNVTERNNNVLQNDFTTPKQENHQQAKENQPLQGRPARMEAGVQEDANNDLNYDLASNGNDDNNDINHDSSDNENDSNNDINYDSQCSDIEEDNANKVIPATQQIHDHSVKTYADPRNDIYLD